MQQSSHKTISEPDSGRAREVRHSSEALLALAPALMQHLRLGMRSGRAPGISVPQFRVLVHASLQPGATLRQLAEPLGVSTATASRMVEGMVLKGLLSRAPGKADRRQVAISLTPAGQQMLDAAHTAARTQFEARLAELDASALEGLATALALLHNAFEVGRSPWTALADHPENPPLETI